MNFSINKHHGYVRNLLTRSWALHADMFPYFSMKYSRAFPSLLTERNGGAKPGLSLPVHVTWSQQRYSPRKVIFPPSNRARVVLVSLRWF